MTSNGHNGTTSDDLAPALPSGRAPEGSPSRRLSSSLRVLGRTSRWELTALLLLFWLAVIVGRVWAPSLLGWRAGIERLIVRSEQAAALLGQLSVLAGALIATQLLMATLVESKLSAVYRLCVAPITAGVVTLVMAAATHDLPMLLSLGLALASGLVALTAAVPTMLRSHTRATGLLLGLGALTVLLQVLGRALALWASQESSASVFRAARGLSTAVVVIDLLALGAAAFWLGGRRWKLLALVAAPAITLSALLAWVALGGGGSPGAWQALVSQAVRSLARHPWPLLPPFVHFMVQVALLLAVALCISARGTQPLARTAVALALLARPGTDIPVLALALLLAALLGPLAAVHEDPSAADQEPRGGDREADRGEQEPSPPAHAGP